ncbi:MAG: hypothetical protein M3Y59_21845 [Myxococcota bacterium]|nr:hypothetical protein [Myxococcota bacterium]
MGVLVSHDRHCLDSARWGWSRRRCSRRPDLPSIERLEQALRDYPGALLLVSHDDALASAVTMITWELREGRVTG